MNRFKQIVCIHQVSTSGKEGEENQKKMGGMEADKNHIVYDG